MIKLLTTSHPAQNFRIVIDGVEFALRLTYQQRAFSWYLDLYPVIEGESAGMKGCRLEQGGMIGAGGDGVRVGFGGFAYVKRLSKDGGELWFVSETEAAALRAAIAEETPVLRIVEVP